MKKILIAIVIVLLAACNNNEKETKTESQVNSQLPAAEEENRANSLISAYLDIKTALTEDDPKQAAEAGNRMATIMKDLNGSGFSPDQQKMYDEVKEDMMEHAVHIGENAGNLHHQREHFETLSKDMYDFIRSDSVGKIMYYMHCPMYNKNKGANWLSADKEVVNPYMGKKMRDCGVVKEELK